MTKRYKGVKKQPHFHSSIPLKSDEEIIALLKKRSHYREAAVKVAVDEAIKRGLINSEQDLFGEKYREQPHAGFSIFPVIENETAKNKTRKSIVRSIVLSGAIPIISGVMEITGSRLPQGIILIILGAIWMFVSSRLYKQVSFKIVNFLFLLLGASLIYVVRLMLSFQALNYMDILVPVIMYSFLIYGLLFVRKL